MSRINCSFSLMGSVALFKMHKPFYYCEHWAGRFYINCLIRIIKNASHTYSSNITDTAVMHASCNIYNPYDTKPCRSKLNKLVKKKISVHCMKQLKQLILLCIKYNKYIFHNCPLCATLKYCMITSVPSGGKEFSCIVPNRYMLFITSWTNCIKTGLK